MREYLVAWDHISKKKKNGWRLAVLHQNIEEEFRNGNKVIRLGVYDQSSDGLVVSFYYTPVTSDLKEDGERLGNELHALRKFRKPEDAWWHHRRIELEETAARLKVATTGTLLGPPIMTADSTKVDIKFEFPTNVSEGELRERLRLGSEAKFQVSFLDALPSQIEEGAVTW